MVEASTKVRILGFVADDGKATCCAVENSVGASEHVPVEKVVT